MDNTIDIVRYQKGETDSGRDGMGNVGKGDKVPGERDGKTTS